MRMRRRRALCSNFRRGARKADVELEGRQSDSHAAGDKNVRVCVAEEGYQLDQVQHGREPCDWKPMNAAGRGVQEIRIRDAAGAFRTEAALLWFAVNKLAINLSADFVDDQYFKVLIVP